MIITKAIMKAKFIQKALEATFNARIGEIRQHVTAEVNKRCAAEHPAFVKALADKELRPYIGVKQSAFPYIKWATGSSTQVRVPNFYKMSTMQKPVFRDCSDQLEVGGVNLPIYIPSEIATFSESSWLATDLAALNAAVTEAHSALWDAIMPATTVAKFIDRYPEMGRYLELPKKASVPAVRTEDVLKRLAAVGIPPEAARV